MTRRPIRVIIAEDQAMIRAAFSRLVDSQPDMTVIAEAANGHEALTHAPHADVIVMDIRMPVMDGISATRRISASCDNTGSHRPKVLILTTFKEEALVLGALDAGAAGFLLKDSEPPVLLDAIRRLARGEGVIDPKVTPMVLRNVGKLEPPQVEGLTARESDILSLVCEGLSNAQIAGRLSIAETTVKTHVTSLLAKTGTHNRVGLVIWAAKRGLIDPCSTETDLR